MKTQLFPALLLVCVTMSGQTGLGIVRPSLSCFPQWDTHFSN